MSSSSDNIFDRYEKNTSKGMGHKVAAAVCALMLVILLGVFIYNAVSEKEAVSVLPRFEEAFRNGDYKEALAIYRSVHDEIVSADPGKEEEYKEQTETMAQMEKIVSEKLEGIEKKVRYERYVPSLADIQFMDSMEELTSSQISNWLHELCEEFLLGTIEKPDIIFIFEQMSQVGNISASVNPLLKEIETIEMARGDVQAAEACFNEGEYVGAVKSYSTVLDKYDGFVYDFSSRRVEEIKEVMYEPMLTEGEHMIETYKYYSAEDLLSDLAVIFPDDGRIKSDLIEATSHTSEVKEYYGSVEVICIRGLICDPKAAYRDGMSSGANETRLTVTEFTRVLEALYENDYVLVDPEALADLSNDTFLLEQSLKIPVGKKPLILVIENLDYSALGYGQGTCTRLVLNESGQVCAEYTDRNGQTTVGRELEAIGILDAFVEAHPDFSYNGSKGVISICGYESCFGYVVDPDEVDDRNQAYSAMGIPPVDFTDEDIESNRKTVGDIMNVLLDTGWKFASSTYGNINAREQKADVIVSDTEKWISQIGSLTGEVHMIVYPGGNYIDGSDERAEYLKSKGFRIFFGIGSQPYYTYGNNYLYYDRSVINPQSLKSYDYSRLFGNRTIMDES
ncbi:MAG: hypothetical protein IKN14_07960 [Clostridiales bacterium]|nr:hypothetical protein [Clostridiales bacterium]